MKVKATALANEFNRTFLSCEKDQEAIWKKLFIESQPYSDILKRLLVINEKDCLDESNVNYRKIVESYSISRLMDEGYLRIIPKLEFGEHEQVRSYIILEFDNYLPTENPEFRDCTISFTIISHLDYWGLEDYKLRPHQIAGFIDGLMNESRLSGIGTLQFAGAAQVVLNEYLGGMVLRYTATHGSDDWIPEEDLE